MLLESEGLLALCPERLLFPGCENNGKIEGSQKCGGIVGIVDVTDGPNNTSMENCVNHGAVYGKNASGVTGRISGMNNGTLLIRNCVNTADLDGKSSVTGGIIGILDGKANGGNITVNDCRNLWEAIEPKMIKCRAFWEKPVIREVVLSKRKSI